LINLITENLSIYGGFNAGLTSIQRGVQIVFQLAMVVP